jgi:hypothetical protein
LDWDWDWDLGWAEGLVKQQQLWWLVKGQREMEMMGRERASV